MQRKTEWTKKKKKKRKKKDQRVSSLIIADDTETRIFASTTSCVRPTQFRSIRHSKCDIMPFGWAESPLHSLLGSFWAVSACLFDSRNHLSLPRPLSTSPLFLFCSYFPGSSRLGILFNRFLKSQYHRFIISQDEFDRGG